MRQEVVLKIAVLAAQIQRGAEGFRPKDVRFVYEQLWNWQTYGAGPAKPPRLHNTQIQRFLEGLRKSRMIRAKGRGPLPIDLLTPNGCFLLAREIRDHALEGSLAEALLIAHFFTGYQDRLVEIAGSREIVPVTDAPALLRSRRIQIEKEIVYWKERVREIREVAEQAKARLRRKDSPETIVADIARTHPYELGYQKPLIQVFDETHRPLMVWELVEGNLLRIRRLWEPRIRILETELQVLDRL